MQALPECQRWRLGVFVAHRPSPRPQCKEMQLLLARLL